MNEPWITVLSVVLVCLGVLAELNLLRIFLRDWRQGRREDRREAFRADPNVAQATRHQMRRATRASLTTPPRARAAIVLAAMALCVVSTPVFAQERPADAPSAAAPSSSPASGAVQPEQPAGAPPTPAGPEPEKPLTISTDRPGFSDTCGFVQVGHLQLETGYTFTFTNRDGVETQTHNGPEMLWRYGIIDDRLELRLGTSGYVYSRSDSGSGFETTDGFSDIAPAVKLKLWDQDGYLPRMCVEALTTVGLGSKGISNRDVEPTIKLIGSWDLGSGFGLTWNAVASYATTNGDRFIQGAGSASLGYSLDDTTSLFFEYFVIGPNTKGSDAAHYTDFGGAHLITNRVQFDARVGFGLNREASNVFAGAGLSFLF